MADLALSDAPPVERRAISLADPGTASVPDMAEIIDLADMDRAILFDEIVLVSRVLRAATDCHKLNVAALGNQVRQLHVHIIARFEHRRRLAASGLGRGRSGCLRGARRAID